MVYEFLTEAQAAPVAFSRAPLLETQDRGNTWLKISKNVTERLKVHITFALLAISRAIREIDDLWGPITLPASKKPPSSFQTVQILSQEMQQLKSSH